MKCCFSTMVHEKLKPLSPWAPTILRVVLGVIFMGHGLDKLFSCFHPGQGGLENTAMAFEGMGLKPGMFHAAMAGWGEFLCGLFVFLGFLTPLGALLISACMVVAIGLVHGPNGLWAQDGGFEYPLLCLAAAVSIILTTPYQKLAVDNLLVKKEGECTKDGGS